MELTAKAGNSDYTFRDIREVMAKANEKRQGTVWLESAQKMVWNELQQNGY